MQVRPMRDVDVEAALPLVEPARPDAWREHKLHLLRTDPGGCWVAEDEALAGFAVSLRRDLLWGLAGFAVRADVRGRGIGGQLLDAALRHSRGCLRGMVCSSGDPAAVRRYRLAGFTVHPTMALRGVVDRRTLPLVEAVRTGTAGDLDLVDSVDRQVRGAARREDRELLASWATLLVCDTFTGSGYAYAGPGRVLVLAATSRRVAQRLLWEALARTEPGRPVRVGNLTADQDWALDVGLAARLSVLPDGYLCLRHMRPPAPYVPSSAFL
jgi:GNAT superfamily N-acetyltransferase